ncbi:MAG: AAA family ATPase, partial [Myxococcota bacterium]
MAKLEDLLQPDHARLVTVLGPPGIGKTRLVQELVAHRLEFESPEEAWASWDRGGPQSRVIFCELYAAADGDEAVAAIAQALGIEPPFEAVEAKVASELRRIPDTLLVCDNLEHIIAPIRAPIAAWLRDAPQLRVLTTSRQRLGMPEETVYELGPLAVRSTSEGEISDSVRLFIDRATAVWPNFDPQDIAQLEEIVALLDGIPLAIELAAARLRVLGPAQLLERLSQRFTLLRSNSTRQVNPRWETLWSALEWSWQLLDDYEQECLFQCVHCVGGFTLEAAEATVLLDAEAGVEVMDVVQALRDKSLLRAWTAPSSPGVLRLGFFQSVREFVLAKHPGYEPSA